jgi:hypothetical protein
MSNNYDYEKLLAAYEECRSDKAAHFRKIIELQDEIARLKSLLDEANELIKRMSDMKSEFRSTE